MKWLLLIIVVFTVAGCANDTVNVDAYAPSVYKVNGLTIIDKLGPTVAGAGNVRITIIRDDLTHETWVAYDRDDIAVTQVKN